MLFCIYSEFCFNPYEKKYFSRQLTFLDLCCRLCLIFLWVAIQISVHFFKPQVCLVHGKSGASSRLHARKQKHPFWGSRPARIPLTLQVWLLHAFFPLVLPARKMMAGFLLQFQLLMHFVTVTHSQGQDTDTQRHTHACTRVLVTSLDFDSPPQGPAFTYSSGSSQSCLYLLKISNYQERQFIEIYRNYFV